MLDAADYAALCDFLRARTGLSFAENKRYYVDRRLAERMAACGIGDPRAYVMLLRLQASGDELQRFVNRLTVNETYFFRERYQLDCLVGSALDELVRGRPKDRPIRIWSAGCSTGEEPYSIAIALLEHWRRVDEYDIELRACDIDTAVLERARDGVYEQRALQYLPDALRAKYFVEAGPGRWRIIDELRESIDFAPVNLVDPEQMRALPVFDIIFCRNLLIYFDEMTRREVAAAFHDALAPGGFIFLGHSESMSRMSSLFVPRKFPDAIIYQKPPAQPSGGDRP